MVKAASGTIVDFRVVDGTERRSLGRSPGGAPEIPPAGTAKELLDDALKRAGRVSPLRLTVGMRDHPAVLP